jgi:SAM-dependent methyltransferase
MLRAGAVDFPGPRIQGDARRLPIASASVAAVWASASLLHFPPEDFRAALGEIGRVLRTPGLLFVTVKHGSGGEWESSRYGAPRFFQYWSEADLDAELAASGFRIIASKRDEAPRNVWLARLASRGEPGRRRVT